MKKSPKGTDSLIRFRNYTQASSMKQEICMYRTVSKTRINEVKQSIIFATATSGFCIAIQITIFKRKVN